MGSSRFSQRVLAGSQRDSFRFFAVSSWRAIEAIELLELLQWLSLKNLWPLLRKPRGAERKFSERSLSEGGIVWGRENPVKGLGGPPHFRTGPWQESNGAQREKIKSSRAGKARGQVSYWFLNCLDFTCTFCLSPFSNYITTITVFSERYLSEGGLQWGLDNSITGQ